MKTLFRFATLLAVASVSSAAFAEKIPLSDFLDVEAKIAMKKMNDELLTVTPSSSGSTSPGSPIPGGLMPSMAPIGNSPRLPVTDGAASRAAPKTTSPVTQIVYGTSSASEVVYRGVLIWNDQSYPVKVGSVVKGYTVSSISSSGTDLTKVSKGKHKGGTIFAPLIVDSGQAATTKPVVAAQPN